MNLHAQMMNLPCNVPAAYARGGADEAVYKIAHRDCRYAAAELALEAAAINEELLSALRGLELGANTVNACYSRNPGNFAAALIDLAEYAEQARVAIAKATQA